MVDTFIYLRVLMTMWTHESLFFAHDPIVLKDSMERVNLG